MQIELVYIMVGKGFYHFIFLCFFVSLMQLTFYIIVQQYKADKIWLK